MITYFLLVQAFKTLDPRLHEGDRNSSLWGHEQPEISVLDSVCWTLYAEFPQLVAQINTGSWISRQKRLL